MAVFKIIDKDEEERKIYYRTQEDLINLIQYVCRNSVIIYTQNLLNIGDMQIANQMLYQQKCSGKKLITRALHFILSFDSLGWEWEVGIDTLESCIYVSLYSLLKEYQCLFGIHDKKSNKHIHIVVNPVAIDDNHIFHWSQHDFRCFMRRLAEDLYFLYGIALQSVSYIKENGHMAWANSEEYIELYENRITKDIPLMDKKGMITKLN